jgi:radical SAM superfamily enzyme YgiQ (UPF0313 family)
MDGHATRTRLTRRNPVSDPRVLLIGPYDPNCGEYTFLAPPLGVWRLQGFLAGNGVAADVFDPNLRPLDVDRDLDEVLRSRRWDVIGVSTTGMTLPFDLSLAHAARAACPDAVIVAGGMEATFNPERMFASGPFDLVILGEGEHPLLALCRRLERGEPLEPIAGTASIDEGGAVRRLAATAMSAAELRESIFMIPYDRMPYEDYWRRLEGAYGVGALPYKAEREAKLAEIRAVRLITLNYCPMGCSFCSSTNFLNSAQGTTTAISRLSADECMEMIGRIVRAHPGVRTIIFQDDIFVFTNDKRLLELCRAIVAAKSRGELPETLGFISTNRIDAMTPERLAAMRAAGFRVLGFGVENFSRNVLKEFNKGRIFRHIEPVLTEALAQGITPFLDLILTSPRSTIGDLAETVRAADRWIRAGCEIGIYPYVIPFSGAALAGDPSLKEQTEYETRRVPGTGIEWQQATKILPQDPAARAAILAIERNVTAAIAASRRPHLPSRDRSLLWIRHAIPVIRAYGERGPDEAEGAAVEPTFRLGEASCALT